MRSFEYYTKRKDIVPSPVNKNNVISLIRDMESRLRDSFSLSEEYKKMIFENIYDALRDFCDALLAKDGYKSYSHEASIFYLLKYNFSVAEISELDNFRIIRNGSKYQGRMITQEDIKNIKEFYNTIKYKIEHLKKELIK